MTSLKTLTLALSFAALTFAAKAQSSTDQNVRISVGLNGGIPSGELATNYSWSIGGLIQADFPIYTVKKLFVTINAGYNDVVGAGTLTGEQIEGPTLTSYTYTPVDFHLLPVKFGLKYFLASNVYVQGEAGVSLLLNKGDLKETHSMAFAFAPQLGYQLPLNSGSFVAAGIVYENTARYSDDDLNKVNLVQLRVSYGF